MVRIVVLVVGEARILRSMPGRANPRSSPHFTSLFRGAILAVAASAAGLGRLPAGDA
jgi:hypothetical protein